MWYLLLVFPIGVLIMGMVTRLRPTTMMDRFCSDIDARLDGQALLAAARATEMQIPAQGHASRVASQPAVATHLEASQPAVATHLMAS